MSRVLSWDVGIINLSFCLLEYNKDNKSWKILDWGIINLTDRDKMKCFECGANPSYFQELNNKKIYTCKNHLKKINIIAPEFTTLFKDNKENICCFTGKNNCEKKSKYVYNNKYFCNTHSKSEYNKILNSYKLKEFSKKSVKDISLEVLKHKLVLELDKRLNLLSANTVIVENQPSLKNPRMKSISSTVYDYYLIRGVIDKEQTNSNITLVKFMSPSNKLKLASNGDTQELIKLKGNDAKTYKLTKSLAIKYCKELIKPYDEWVIKFNSYKKKDDMADSFLQGLYYIMNT
jgi:hypothetical protein